MKGSDRLLRSAEQIIRPVSWATLPLLIALPLLRNAGLWSAPGWVTAWLMPILTGAAVGYLTNFIAIEMLFKPYRRTDRHWLRYATLGIWRQGLIPANKDRIGRVLGEEIPRNLIDPDEIATEIGKAATELFENESLLLRLRDVATRFLQRYSERISEFIAPHVEEALRAGLRDNLTTENLRRLWDEVAAGYLNAPENREKLASAIIDELRKRSPELASLLRDNLRSGVRDYLREALHDTGIDRRVLHGTQDMGDIYGIRSHGCDVIAECKAHRDVTPALVARWRDETLRERGNADADAAVLVVKRARRGIPESECHMTVRDYLLIAGLELPVQTVGFRRFKSITDTANMLRVSVLNASLMFLPMALPARSIPGAIFPAILPRASAVCGVITPCPAISDMTDDMVLPICPAAVVPMLPIAPFCLSLKIDISRLVNSYPPSTSTCGRYFVRAALRVSRATSCFSLAMFSCLLLRNAIARQLSSDNTRCAPTGRATDISESKIVTFFI